MKKLIPLTISILFLTSACAPKPPPSNYVEVNLSQSGANTKNTWQICYAGAFSDDDILTGHLSGEYVSYIFPGFPGFKRKTTIVENTSNGNLVIKNSKNNTTVASFNRSAFKEKDIYITINSNTTGGWIIPLPFVVASKLDGTRAITPVDKATFDTFCGTTTGTIFIKPN
jgi:hypothetical protein